MRSFPAASARRTFLCPLSIVSNLVKQPNSHHFSSPPIAPAYHSESPRVRPGKVVTLSYVARIAPNSPRGERRHVFDSATQDKPLRFIAGSDAVIRGWSYGVVGMCVGERRRLTIPAAWAYGEEGTKGVPPGATVEIDMTLHKVEKAPNLFAEIDANRDGRLTEKEIRAWLQNKGVPKEEIEVVVRHLLEQDDANEDGVITINEYSGPRGD